MRERTDREWKQSERERVKQSPFFPNGQALVKNEETRRKKRKRRRKENGGRWQRDISRNKRKKFSIKG